MKNGSNGGKGVGDDATEAAAAAGGAAIKRLEADAGKLMQELSGLASRLKTAGQGLGDAAAGTEAFEGAADQLNAIKERLNALTSDSQQTLAQLDKSVRANPYLWIIGALGLGVLVGKVMRS